MARWNNMYGNIFGLGMDDNVNNEIQEETPPQSVSNADVPSPGKAIKIFIVYFLLGIPLMIPFGIIKMSIHASGDFYIYPKIIIYLIVLFLMMRSVNLSGYKLIDSFKLFSIPKTIILPLILIALGFSFFNTILDPYVRYIFNHIFSTDIKSYAVTEPQHLWVWPGFFIFSVIVAPLFEELTDRGLLMTSFQHKFGYKKAIIISAALFGLMHFHPSYSITMAFMALFFGYVVYKTKSILSGIIMHSTNNILATTLRALGIKGISHYLPQNDILFLWLIDITISLLSIAMIITGIIYLNRRLNNFSQSRLDFIDNIFRRKNEICTTSSPSSETIDQ
jgi:membrane protease YdiL (CAAX protease family)